MSPVPDPYREWDAAYVLGSLSPSERHEYEQHLTACSTCSADVAELAGISGVLRAVPSDRAMALLSADPAAAPVGTETAEIAQMPPNLLPSLVRAARRSQSRGRRVTWVAGGLAAVAASILVMALALGMLGSPAGESRRLTMAQTAASPITAEATLTEQLWGTTIELECTYALAYAGGPISGSERYGLYVIDRSGAETEQATWAAAPGSTVTPTSTTALSIEEIVRIEIRWLETGRVILEASP